MAIGPVFGNRTDLVINTCEIGPVAEDRTDREFNMCEIGPVAEDRTDRGIKQRRLAGSRFDTLLLSGIIPERRAQRP